MQPVLTKAEEAEVKAAKAKVGNAESQMLRYRNDPKAFVEEIIGATPEKWQADALNAIAKNDRVAIRSGHGVGKSCFQAWLVLWFMCTRYPVKMILTANTINQINDVLMAEIAKWHRGMNQVFRDMLVIKADRVELKGAESESFAVARVSRKETPESLQGFHSDNLMFLIDEASGIPDIVFEVASGALSTKGAKQVLTGNPTRANGYFYDAFNKMREKWKLFKVSCADSTRVDPGFLEDMKTQYGEDSSIYGVRVLGDFPREADDVLIPLHLVESAVERDVEPTGDFVWGVDVARFGDDRSCLVKRQGNTVLEPPMTWRQKDTMQLAGLVNAEYFMTPSEQRPVEIMVDVIGLGAGVVDRLAEMGLPVRGVSVSESPSVKEKFEKRRDELWYELREWFSRRDCKIPDDANLITELTSPTFKYQSNGKLKVEGKSEMKRRGVPSPDVADAFMITMESAAHNAGMNGGNFGGWNKKLDYSQINRMVV